MSLPRQGPLEIEKGRTEEQRLPQRERPQQGDAHDHDMAVPFPAIGTPTWAHVPQDRLGQGLLARPGGGGGEGGGTGVGPYLPSDPAGPLLETRARTTGPCVEVGVCRDYHWGMG